MLQKHLISEHEHREVTKADTATRLLAIDQLE